MQLSALRPKQTHLYSKLLRGSILTVSGKGREGNIYSLQLSHFSVVFFKM